MKKLDLSSHPLGSHAKAAGLLQSISDSIESLSQKLLELYPAPPHNFFATDFVVFAAAKRTLSVGRGFLSMIETRNFGVAAALLRMQLDTSIRFYAMTCVENQSDFATQMLKGEKINKMKSKLGHKLTDKYLVERLAPAAPWISTVYDETSGFVHLSGRHIYQIFSKLDEENRTAQFQVSAEDAPRPAEDYIEILSAFDATTNLAISLMTSFLKARPA